MEVYLLNINQQDSKITANVITNLKKSCGKPFQPNTLQLKYKNSFLLLLNESKRDEAFEWLQYNLDLEPKSIHQVNIICNVDLRTCHFNLSELLSNHLGMNISSSWKGSLVVVEGVSLQGTRNIHRYFRENAICKQHIVTIQDQLNIHFSIAIANFIQLECNKFTGMFNLNKHVKIFKVDFYKTSKSNSSIGIPLRQYFEPVGLFKFENGYLYLIHDDEIRDPFITTHLPKVSFDIETIANNLTVVPFGGTMSEKISSIVLYVEYKGIHIAYVLYLINTSKYEKEDEEFKKNFFQKYHGIDKNMLINIESFKEEVNLISRFMELYVYGEVFQNLKLSSIYPHLLLGHNIINYDLPVIATRLHVLKMSNYIRHIKITGYYKANPSSKKLNPYYQFHPNAIIFDLFRVVQRNFPGMPLTLKEISKVYLPAKYQKNDLDATTIRKFYIIDQNIKDDDKRLVDFFKVDVDALLPMDDEGNQININQIQFPIVKIDAHALPDVVTGEIKNLSIPTLEHVLIYNIMDCLSVLKIFEVGNFYNLFMILSNLLYTDLETASMSGNSIRLKTYMMQQGFEMGEFLGERKEINHVHAVKTLDDFRKGDLNNIHSIAINNYNGKKLKKKYDGALNYAKEGLWAENTCFDFASYYPNLLTFRSMSMNGLSVMSVDNLLKFNELMDLDEYIKNGLLTIHCAEDPPSLEHFNLSYRGREIAHLVESVIQLKQLPRESKVFVFNECNHSDAIHKMTIDLLKERAVYKNKMKAIKKEPKSTVNLMLYNLYDCKQLAFKIMANSQYGVMGTNSFVYGHISSSAYVTLLGRKYLSIMSRAITYYSYKWLLENSNEGEIIHNLKNKKITHLELDVHYEYLKRAAAYRLLPDGKFVSAPTNDCRLNDAQYNSFLDSDIITFTDTDGIQFVKKCPVEKLHQFVNVFLKERCHTTRLNLENEYSSLYTGILGRKHYYALLENNKIKHVGYEKNAPVIIKVIYCAAAKLSILSRTLNSPINLFRFFVDAYRFLESANHYDLATKIQLNEHKNKTTNLAKYIESNAAGTYMGNVKTVFYFDRRVPITDSLAGPMMQRSKWIEALENGEDIQLDLHQMLKGAFIWMARILLLGKIKNRSTIVKHLKSILQGQLIAKCLFRYSLDEDVSIFNHGKISNELRELIIQELEDTHHETNVIIKRKPINAQETQSFIERDGYVKMYYDLARGGDVELVVGDGQVGHDVFK